jgi:transposase
VEIKIFVELINMNEEWLDDARKIPDDVMGYVRKIAVRAIEEGGFSPESIAEVFQINRTAIYAWLRRFKDGGYPALDTKKAAGAISEITESMEEWIRCTVLECTPEDFGYETALWTRDVLAEIINDKFDLNVVGSTVGKHLRKIGLSYQKPWFRAQEQDPEKVLRFVNKTFPRIQRLAGKLGADIGFEDEAGVGLQTHSGKTWGEVGKTPEVSVTGKRGGYNVLSMITADGVLRFSIRDKAIDSDQYVEFLSGLIKARDRPLILIADRARFHHSKHVRNFVRSHRQNIRVYFLPPYSPELNPDEQVWNELKNRTIERKSIKTKSLLRSALYKAMHKLQYQTEKIRSFFELPHTKYAANECAAT